VASFTALTYCEFTSIYPESGEAYLYARKTFAPPVAYMVGWALLLGYTASCAFYISSLSAYFNEFIWRGPYEPMAGMLALVGLTLLNIRGTRESSHFQIAVTAGKVVLLLLFVWGGLGTVSLTEMAGRFETDLFKIGGTSAMVFITFFGFSAIAASAGEVAAPTQTIPRAIFLSVAVVTVLYTLVVAVMLGAGLTEYGEAAMGEVARLFLGPVGGTVVVGGAIFSMISASNASIMAGSRVALAMSRLGHLPVEMAAIHPETRTPVVALTLVGGSILLFSLMLPLEDLAHFADIVLLLALVFVNVALILHRRAHPDLERPFRVPFVPLLPSLAILANLYLLVLIAEHRLPLTIAAGALLVGLLGFVAWKGFEAEVGALPGEPSRVAFERAGRGEKRFGVLVPIANPANVGALVDLAAGIAADRQGEIIALRVVLVPEQIEPREEDAHVERERRLLEAARARAQERGVPCTAIVRVGHHLARAILETARERECDLIVLGWKGYTSTARRILGEDVDSVVRLARANIVLVKLTPESTEVAPRRLLLPSAGGPHARLAEQYAVSLARNGGSSITLCNVIPPGARLEQIQEAQGRLREAAARIGQANGVETLLVRNGSVVDGIVRESEDYDAVVVGAAEKSKRGQILLGNIPENIARRTKTPVIVVKRYDPVKALLQRILSG